MNKKEYILCSAIHFDDNKIHKHQPTNIKSGIVICGRRHLNCIYVFQLMFPDIKNVKERLMMGFITNTDKFVNRQEGFIIAKNANQIISKNTQYDEMILISEDLY